MFYFPKEEFYIYLKEKKKKTCAIAIPQVKSVLKSEAK